MTEALIELVHVWKIFGEGEAETAAVRDVSLVVETGEFVAIMGASGSGKSTLMNQIGILDTPTRGDVFIKHHKVSDMSENERARVRREELGFVFQQFNLIPTFTVLENVEIPMVLRDMGVDERKEIAETILKSLELGHRLNYYPNQLSGGQQQRVAVARAVAATPKLILADEPTANLDSKTAASLMDMMQRLNEDEGVTIIFSSHDPLVIGKAKHSVVLKDGEVIANERVS